MHDFDSNEDLRLPGSGREEGGEPEPVYMPPPRRLRQAPFGHAARRRPARAARHRLAARRACPLQGRPLLVEATRRRRAACARPPGPPS
jgi:hypothetical protein